MPSRGSITPMLLVVAVVGLMACVLTSPILLVIIATYDPDPVSWTDLANVGQAYGGTAALVSALALAGIAGSLFLQWRQNRLTQLLVIRERHFDLVKLCMEQPELLRTFGFSRDPTESVIIAYASLWMGHWAVHWDLHAMEEKPLRFLLQELFQNEVILQWWTEYGAHWSSSAGRRRAQFIKIVMQEHDAALARAAPIRTDQIPPA